MKYTMKHLLPAKGSWRAVWSIRRDKGLEEQWHINDEARDWGVANLSFRDGIDDHEQVAADAWLIAHAPDLFRELVSVLAGGDRQNAINLIKRIEAGYFDE